MNQLEHLEALILKLFERRKVDLFKGIRYEREVIAAKMAHEGTLNSGGFVVAVTNSYVDGFKRFAQGLTTDAFDVLERSGVELDAEKASWLKRFLEQFMEGEARNVCAEAMESSVLRNELRDNVQRAMETALYEVKRDLVIELELRSLAKNQPVAVVDEALRDQLVPLQNRRGLEQAFNELTKESEAPACIALFDIDHFKQVNDKQGGHAVGDEALVSIAKTAAACVRGKGAAFRYGGDEFVLLLPNHTIEEGLAVAERFRAEVDNRRHTSVDLPLTVSVGVALWPDNGRQLDEVMKVADRALYGAKENGRNVVCSALEPVTRRVAPERPEPEPSIKWVDLEYPKKSGLQERLSAQGLTVTWRRDDRPRDDDAIAVKLEDNGQTFILKVKSADSPLTLYQRRQ